VIRAGLESIAYSSRDVVDCMVGDAGLELKSLRVDGGACQNDFLMQFQADILGRIVERPQVLEVTALGAAALAGLAVGFWRDRSDLENSRGETMKFEPRMPSSEADALYAGWKRAVERSQGWAD
jgi:glycerol kinase